MTKFSHLLEKQSQQDNGATGMADKAGELSRHFH
jgi:hypothetical protein